MRYAFLLGILLIAVAANAQNPAEKAWKELEAKRAALPSLHQEFDVAWTLKAATEMQKAQYRVVVDMSKGRWRQKMVSGWGDEVRIFDGRDVFAMETGGNEYAQVERKSNDGAPEPDPYCDCELDVASAKEVAKGKCGLSGKDDACIVFEMPVKRWMRVGTYGGHASMSQGKVVEAIDTKTGALVQSHFQGLFQGSGGDYVEDEIYSLKRISYGGEPDAGLFALPQTGLRKVNHLTPWNAARVKKELAGKPAPELHLTDLQGKQISLREFRGKTVLLDFWATWCPPCVADGPALDKLYRKYGGKQLMIIGISEDEGRSVMEAFLKKHPHTYPEVLTTENPMARPYVVGDVPTYIVIAPDGTVATAISGNQSFNELRGSLEKAGMKAD